MKRILIVDDQEGWRMFHTNTLKKVFIEEYSTETAASAEEGYTKVFENIATPYDIIITDLQMEDNYLPKLAGEWLVEQIKSLSSYYKTKIIIISASPRIKTIAETFNVHYLTKASAISSQELYKETVG